MKKLILTITLGTLAIANALAQIPNAGFENWTKPLLIEDPTGWLNLNIFSFDGGPITITKVNGETGFALKAEVMEFTNKKKQLDTLAGFTITGSGNYFTQTLTLGFPVNGRPEKFSGLSKFSSPKQDTAVILVGFSKWNKMTNKADSIGGTYAMFYTNQTSLTEFASPIYWNSSATPDTAVIYIFSSVTKKPIPGTSLIIDDLAFLGGVNGVVDALSSMKNVIYPNPAINELNIDDVDLAATTITVTDLAGKIVDFKEIETSQKLMLNTSNYVGGMYFYELKNNQQLVVQKGKFTVSK